MNLNEIRMADVYGIQIEIHQYTSNVAFTRQSYFGHNNRNSYRAQSAINWIFYWINSNDTIIQIMGKNEYSPQDIRGNVLIYKYQFILCTVNAVNVEIEMGLLYEKAFFFAINVKIRNSQKFPKQPNVQRKKILDVLRFYFFMHYVSMGKSLFWTQTH